MLPYWLLYVMTAIPALVSGRSPRSVTISWAGILLALFITFLVGLRYEVGADWEPYVLIFDDIRYMNLGDALARTDPAYALINWMVGAAGWDIWVVNLICAAVFTWGLMTFAFRLPNPWLAIAAATPYLIVVVAMGYTRQGVAIGCLLIGLTAIQKESFAKFLFWLLIAATFHRSALVLLPLVGLAYTRNRVLVILFGTIAAAMAYYLLVVSNLEAIIENYTENDYESQGALIRIMMNIVPALLFLFTKSRYPVNESERKMWRNFAIAALASLPLFYVVDVTTVLDRFALYMIPLQVFVLAWLPQIFGSKSGPNRLAISGVLVYSAFILLVWLNYATHAEFWLPYQIVPAFTPY